MKTIELTQGQVTLVDDEDYDRLSQYNWSAQYSPLSKAYYAVTTLYDGGIRRRIIMHRFILNAPRGCEVDHQNHNTLDNRKNNIKLTTASGNRKNAGLRSNNTSGFCGVHWDKPSKRWRASIRLGNRTIVLGRFLDKQDAIEARKAANIKYGFHENHGELVVRHAQSVSKRSYANTRTSVKNSSGLPGVRWYRQKKRWIARITIDGKEYRLGSFVNKAEAVAARADAVKQCPHHGKNENVESVISDRMRCKMKNKFLPKNNTSGMPGVYFVGKVEKWRVVVGVNKKKIQIGYFKDKGDAIAARAAANTKYGFHPNHGKKPI